MEQSNKNQVLFAVLIVSYEKKEVFDVAKRAREDNKMTVFRDEKTYIMESHIIFTLFLYHHVVAF